MTKPKPTYKSVNLSSGLDTFRVVKDCEDLTPPDENGRRVPQYLVIHRALVREKARLQRKEKP